jgi:ABC-type lipoprotein release transport system permease subunit
MNYSVILVAAGVALLVMVILVARSVTDGSEHDEPEDKP